MTLTRTQTPAVFTPEAVQSINRAFIEAVDIIRSKGGQDSLRVQLAEHMMFLARNGETDQQRLCTLSVTAVLGYPSYESSASPARDVSAAGR